jgi:hypothetical protein
MTDPYRTSAEPPKEPGKIVQVSASMDRVYILDEDGLLWFTYHSTNYVGNHTGWSLVPNSSQRKERKLPPPTE